MVRTDFGMRCEETRNRLVAAMNGLDTEPMVGLASACAVEIECLRNDVEDVIQISAETTAKAPFNDFARMKLLEDQLVVAEGKIAKLRSREERRDNLFAGLAASLGRLERTASAWRASLLENKATLIEGTTTFALMQASEEVERWRR